MLSGSVSVPEIAMQLPYRLYVPKSYDRTRAYPLILFLHGSGSNGDDNVSQLVRSVEVLVTEAQRYEPAFVLAPQCPRGTKWVVRPVPRPPFLNYDQSSMAEGEAAKLVIVALDEILQKYSVAEDRIYITGMSSGGTGTWDAITRHPSRFAAAIPITGANDPSRAPVIADMPIWTFHGELDELSPVQNTREMVRELRRLGSPVRFTELENVGHNSWGPAYADERLFRWLFAQKRAVPSRKRGAE
jgi:predicted peptidase